MAILDAAGKEVKIGDRVAYASRGYMSLNIATVQGCTPKGIRMVVGKERDWEIVQGLLIRIVCLHVCQSSLL